MGIDLHNLVQEYCDGDENHRNFTYKVLSKEFIFYLYFKDNILAMEELEKFHELYSKSGLKERRLD